MIVPAGSGACCSSETSTVNPCRVGLRGRGLDGVADEARHLDLRAPADVGERDGRHRDHEHERGGDEERNEPPGVELPPDLRVDLGDAPRPRRRPGRTARQSLPAPACASGAGRVRRSCRRAEAAPAVAATRRRRRARRASWPRPDSARSTSMRPARSTIGASGPTSSGAVSDRCVRAVSMPIVVSAENGTSPGDRLDDARATRE